LNVHIFFTCKTGLKRHQRVASALQQLLSRYEEARAIPSSCHDSPDRMSK